MPITVQCSCGKRMGVSDALAGKTVRCSACGDAIEVGAGRAAAPAAAGKKGAATGKKGAAVRSAPRGQSASPAIYISKGKVVFLSTLAALGLICLICYLGPVRAWNQWDAVRGQANDDVSDVISYGLQAYLSQQMEYDPKESHAMPSVDGGIHFFWPWLVMSVPEKIHFLGLTTQGPFQGYYHPSTGEIEADVTYGGRTFAGMVQLAKSTGQFHMTGRMSKGFPQAELNGTPLKMYQPPADGGNQ